MIMLSSSMRNAAPTTNVFRLVSASAGWPKKSTQLKLSALVPWVKVLKTSSALRTVASKLSRMLLTTRFSPTLNTVRHSSSLLSICATLRKSNRFLTWLLVFCLWATLSPASRTSVSSAFYRREATDVHSLLSRKRNSQLLRQKKQQRKLRRVRLSTFPTTSDIYK